jgi:hypothetical protein
MNAYGFHWGSLQLLWPGKQRSGIRFKITTHRQSQINNSSRGSNGQQSPWFSFALTALEICAVMQSWAWDAYLTY